MINLINKLKEHLEKMKINYYSDSIDFRGKREKVPQPDGSYQDLYAVTYMVSSNDNKYDSDFSYCAYFDLVSENLLYIIGPQSYKKIN